MSPKQKAYKLGLWGEWFVKQIYRLCGYQCLGSRIKTPFGEIDLIFLKNNKLYFVEVKTRKKFESHCELISDRQINRLKNASQIFLSHKKLTYEDMQIDCVFVYLNRLPIFHKNIVR